MKRYMLIFFSALFLLFASVASAEIIFLNDPNVPLDGLELWFYRVDNGREDPIPIDASRIVKNVAPEGIIAIDVPEFDPLVLTTSYLSGGTNQKMYYRSQMGTALIAQPQPFYTIRVETRGLKSGIAESLEAINPITHDNYSEVAFYYRDKMFIDDKNSYFIIAPDTFRLQMSASEKYDKAAKMEKAQYSFNTFSNTNIDLRNLALGEAIEIPATVLYGDAEFTLLLTKEMVLRESIEIELPVKEVVDPFIRYFHSGDLTVDEITFSTVGSNNYEGFPSRIITMDEYSVLNSDNGLMAVEFTINRDLEQADATYDYRSIALSPSPEAIAEKRLNKYSVSARSTSSAIAPLYHYSAELYGVKAANISYLTMWDESENTIISTYVVDRKAPALDDGFTLHFVAGEMIRLDMEIYRPEGGPYYYGFPFSADFTEASVGDTIEITEVVEYPLEKKVKNFTFTLKITKQKLLADDSGTVYSAEEYRNPVAIEPNFDAVDTSHDLGESTEATGISAPELSPSLDEKEQSEVVKVVVSDNGVNIRSGGGTDFSVVGKVSKGDEFDVVSVDSSGWYEIALPEGGSAFISPRKIEVHEGFSQKQEYKAKSVKTNVDYLKSKSFDAFVLVEEGISFWMPEYWGYSAELDGEHLINAEKMYCDRHNSYYYDENVPVENWEVFDVFVKKNDEHLVLDELLNALRETGKYTDIEKVSFNGNLKIPGQKTEAYSGREWILYDDPEQNVFYGTTFLEGHQITFRFAPLVDPHMRASSYRELGHKIMASVHGTN